MVGSMFGQMLGQMFGTSGQMVQMVGQMFGQMCGASGQMFGPRTKGPGTKGPGTKGPGPKGSQKPHVPSTVFSEAAQNVGFLTILFWNIEPLKCLQVSAGVPRPLTQGKKGSAHSSACLKKDRPLLSTVQTEDCNYPASLHPKAINKQSFPCSSATLARKTPISHRSRSAKAFMSCNRCGKSAPKLKQPSPLHRRSSSST